MASGKVYKHSLFGMRSVMRNATQKCSPGDLILAFEILSVYPGTKYDRTVISEIYFDGMDVH